jgi:hypothetical protein
MRNLLLAALAVAVAATLPGGGAEAAKKIHKIHHARHAYQSYPPRGAVPIYPDPSGGNAAAAGNNANSMSGSNSPGENAIGRTNGSGPGGFN